MQSSVLSITSSLELENQINQANPQFPHFKMKMIKVIIRKKDFMKVGLPNTMLGPEYVPTEI